MADRFAGMVQLGGEKEVSVVYFSKHWEELGDLLEAPLEFIRSRQYLFDREPGEDSQWRILSPVNVELECGWKDLNNLVLLLGMVPSEAKPLGPSPKEYKERAGDAAERLMTNVDILSTILARLGFAEKDWESALPPPGSFFVEFAAFTNNLRVFYFPPGEAGDAIKKRQERREISNPCDWDVRYKGGIDKALLVEWDTGSGLKSAILHFDIKERSQRSRAEFLMTLIEDPYWICDLLNLTSSRKEFSYGTATMVDKGRIQFASITKSTGLSLSFEPGTPLTAVLGTKAPPYWEFPKLYVTNLSTPKPTPVCQVGKPCPINGSYLIGGGSNEAYMRQEFDPETFFRDAVLRSPDLLDEVTEKVRNAIKSGTQEPY